jgi:hypothetical protein
MPAATVRPAAGEVILRIRAPLKQHLTPRIEDKYRERPVQLTQAVCVELVPLSLNTVIGIDQDHALQGILLPGTRRSITSRLPDDRCLQVVISKTA